MASFRRFTSHDYLGYEGAELLPDGTSPLISTRESTEDYLSYLITGSGDPDRETYHMAVHVLRPIKPGTAEEERIAEGEAEEWWFREEKDAAVARRVGSLLPRDADPVTLLALGFNRTV